MIASSNTTTVPITESLWIMLFFIFCFVILFRVHYIKKDIRILGSPAFWLWGKESYLAAQRYSIGGVLGFSIGSLIMLADSFGIPVDNTIGKSILIFSVSLIGVSIFAGIFSRPKFIIPPLLKDSPSLFAEPKEIEEYLDNLEKKLTEHNKQLRKENKLPFDDNWSLDPRDHEQINQDNSSKEQEYND